MQGGCLDAADACGGSWMQISSRRVFGVVGEIGALQSTVVLQPL